MTEKNIFYFGIPQGRRELINSLCILSNEKFVFKFNNLFTSNYGPEYSSYATYKGRSAIYLLLKSLNIEEGSEILVPSFICETVILPILRAKMKPKLIDIDPNTYTIDIKKLEESIGPKTKAIIGVHTFGFPCDMDSIIKIAKDTGITVIEDCAQAIGAEYHGKKVGTLGDAAIFSFHIDKIMSTGHGGLILTKNQDINTNIRKNFELFERCNIIDNCNATYRFFQGFRNGFPKLYSYIKKIDCSLIDTPPCVTYYSANEKYNKKMSPVSARIGIVQLMKVNNMVEKRRQNAKILDEVVRGIDFLEPPRILKDTNPTYLHYPMSLKTNNIKKDRIKIIKELNKNNIEANNYIWPCGIHQIPAYKKDCVLGSNDFTGTNKVVQSIINIPLHPLLDNKDMEKIIKIISSINI